MQAIAVLALDLRVCAAEPGGLQTTAGFSVAVAHALESLARQALMTRRTFARYFRVLTGTTVGQSLAQDLCRDLKVLLF